MKKWMSGALAIVSVGALTLALPATAEAAPPSAAAQAPSVSWGSCASFGDSGPGLVRAGAQCARVKVPLDYAKPRGTKITIAISRVKHTVARSKYQGVVLVNPGGPGGSGLGLSRLGGAIPKNAGAAYDWIGFDPRGVGQSAPAVSCDPNYGGYDRPRYEPSTTEIRDAWFARTNAYTTACAEKNGPILDHLTTRDVAKDLDQIRIALGQKRINYYGFSYGTYLGQVYSSLFPSHVRRMIFDGTVDPRDVWYQGNLNQNEPFDKNVNRWFAWIAKYDDVYHLGTTTRAVRNLFYDTQEKLYDEPVADADGNRLGGSEWNDSFLYAGYYQSTWTDLAQVFSDFVNQGDVASLNAAYLDASGYGDDNGYAVYLGVQCTDAAWPTSWEKWARDNWALDAIAPFETWANAWYNEPCRHWPAKTHQPVRVKGAKSTSVLMINETYDAATPYAGSIEVRKRYPGARLVAVSGGTTHSGSLGGNACTDNRIADYLLTGKLPRRVSGNRADVVCQPLPQPVPEQATARTQSATPAPSELRQQMQRDAIRP
jgi:pimeloyl-ACP methyl ester carboxylesterase